MIKRFIALMLCLIMAVSLLSSCTIRKKDDTDKGAIINMYLSEEVYDFDPAYALNNDASLKIVNLLFSGLFSGIAVGVLATLIYRRLPDMRV